MGTVVITNQIRLLRFQKNEMTQSELADLVGVSRQAILSIENQKYVPSLELGFKIARAFHKNIEEVFNYKEE